jgi:hypothetical protein
LGGRILRQYTQSYAIDILIQATILIAAILIVGGGFFKLVEQPCMQRDWHQKLYFKTKSTLRSCGLLPVGRA